MQPYIHRAKGKNIADVTVSGEKDNKKQVVRLKQMLEEGREAAT
eukprot:gene13251-9094_t